MSSESKPLLDFLYADHERVASFLAQIQGEGSLKESYQAGTTQKKGQRHGDLKLGLFEAGLAEERDWGKEVRLTYDPLWANSRKLIDHIEEHGPTGSYALGSFAWCRAHCWRMTFLRSGA